MKHLHDFLPYMLAHKGRTFVCVLTHQIVSKKRALESIVNQLCIMHSLGIRLVLIANTYGEYTYVSRALEARIAMKNARMRMMLERVFSVSMPRSTHGKYPVYLVSGNFATARPQGVLDGVDTQCAGVVRSVDTDAITRVLDAHAIVLLTTSLYSVLESASLVVDWQQIARKVTQQMNADKLIVLHGDTKLATVNATIDANATHDATDTALMGHPLLRYACSVAQQSAPRVHLVYGAHKDALLQELFSQEGKGLLVSRQAFERIEPASVDDLGELLALIRPYEAKGMLTIRQRARLEEDLPHYYYVLKRDTAVVTSGALIPFAQAQIAEIACLAVMQEAHGTGLGSHMLNFLEQRARTQGFATVFCLTTQAKDWFVEHGYSETSLAQLPIERAANHRNSCVLIKRLA